MDAPKPDDILFYHAEDPELGIDLLVKLKVLEYPTGTNYKSVRGKVEEVLKGEEYAVGDEDIFDLQYTSTTQSPVTHTNDEAFKFVESMEKTNTLPPAPKEFLPPLEQEPVPPPVKQSAGRRRTPKTKKSSRRTTKSKRSKSAPRKK